MAFLVGGANSASGAYEIDNSCRFNNGDSPKLEIDYSASATNRKKWTASFWAKRGIIGSHHQYIFGFDGSGNIEEYVMFESSAGSLYFDSRDATDGSSEVYIYTDMKFRDPSAWYHIVIAADSTQGTAGNRFKVYVNGTQQSLTTSTAVSEDYEFFFSETTGDKRIGTTFNNNYYDGYLSEFHFIDGTQYAASVFGETDDNGVWIPKDCKGDITYGNNGFYLEFKETGTSQNSSGIGADTSGNDNHWSVTNLAATDVTTDTPTNNFATFNSVYASNTQTNGYRTTLSEGNLKAVSQADGKTSGISSIGVANGKWYAEFKQTAVSNANGYGLVGVHSDLTPMLHNNPNGNGVLGYSPHGYAYWGYNASTSDGYKMNDDNNSTYGSPYDAGDIIGLAIDLDNGAMYVSLNGTFQESSDPTSGASKTNAIFALPAASTKPDGFYFMSVGDSSSTHTVTWEANFGNPTFAISSGNADANGYGNFEYAVPSGFYALCTKNLAKYG
jgi:hypothetical protein